MAHRRVDCGPWRRRCPASDAALLLITDVQMNNRRAIFYAGSISLRQFFGMTRGNPLRQRSVKQIITVSDIFSSGTERLNYRVRRYPA